MPTPCTSKVGGKVDTDARVTMKKSPYKHHTQNTLKPKLWQMLFLGHPENEERSVEETVMNM